MKIKNLYIQILLSGALLLGACQNALDVEPEFQKDGSQIFTNLQDYEFALTGSYALFRQVGYYGSGGQTTSTWGALPDMMGDNLVRTSEDLANWQIQVNWAYASDEDDIEVAWVAAYSIIAQTNLVLRNIEQFSAAEAQRVNRIKGQALAIRAMTHFDILRYWGESYDRNSNAQGIPYLEVVDINNMPARLTVAESYNKIFADMEQAEALLGDVDRAINSGNSRAYIDQLAVRALLARMHLYTKNYAQAESYATQVIDARPLASKEAFPNIWLDASTDEVIWTVAFNPGEGSPSIGIHISANNRNRYRPAEALLDTFDPENDIRYPAYFGTRVLAGVERNIVRKFFGRAGAADNLVNWKAIRTAEMYLIRAEARALQAGREADGLADLNALRAARINNYVAENLSGSALLDAIALERRKELFSEGHRWFDLRRTTLTIDRGTDCGAGSANCRLLPTAREWVWPIPQLEIDSNPVISTQQTSGYD